jgi:hypothetical protein
MPLDADAPIAPYDAIGRSQFAAARRYPGPTDSGETESYPFGRPAMLRKRGYCVPDRAVLHCGTAQRASQDGDQDAPRRRRPDRPV